LLQYNFYGIVRGRATVGPKIGFNSTSFTCLEAHLRLKMGESDGRVPAG
jgi:hypothetical protein